MCVCDDLLLSSRSKQNSLLMTHLRHVDYGARAPASWVAHQIGMFNNWGASQVAMLLGNLLVYPFVTGWTMRTLRIVSIGIIGIPYLLGSKTKTHKTTDSSHFWQQAIYYHISRPSFLSSRIVFLEVPSLTRAHIIWMIILGYIRSFRFRSSSHLCQVSSVSTCLCSICERRTRRSPRPFPREGTKHSGKQHAITWGNPWGIPRGPSNKERWRTPQIDKVSKSKTT